jgi:hypothetical protein
VRVKRWTVEWQEIFLNSSFYRGLKCRMYKETKKKKKKERNLNKTKTSNSLNK